MKDKRRRKSCLKKIGGQSGLGEEGGPSFLEATSET